MVIERNSWKVFLFATILLLGCIAGFAAAEEVVKVGLNCPRTGPYRMHGNDQFRAAEMAIEMINEQGGILGRPVQLVWRDSQSKADLSAQNVTRLIENEGVRMVFGGSTSAVAISSAQACRERNIPFFGTLAYSTTATGRDGHRHMFRECYNTWMGAKAIGIYLKQNYSGKRYFYITADYTWGHTFEASLRAATGTADETEHKRILTPFPGATPEDFEKAAQFAGMVESDVLVLVLYGDEMIQALREVTKQGLKSKMQVVVPNLTLGMAQRGGPKVMEGVIGALPWCWQVPYKYDYAMGKSFVENFSQRYDRYPSTSGASAYTILWEYKAAVERAGSFDTAAVIEALEGHEYQWLKDNQRWRDFDHQSVQTVYTVKCKPRKEVHKDKFKLDYFEIVHAAPGEQVVRSHDEWKAVRRAAGKPDTLEPLPSK